MALDKLIPRLEWNFLAITGNRTAGDETISGIADTTEIVVGMLISGTGIPAGTTVTSKTANSIEMSAQATSGSATSTALTMWQRFDFEFPPEKDSEEKYAAKNTVKESLSGVQQVQTNYVEITRDLLFGMLTHDDRDTLLEDFYLAWAVYGNQFRYYYDLNDSSYVTYELEKYTLSTPRRAKKHPYFLYDMAFTFRRVA